MGQQQAVFVCARHAVVLSQQQPSWLLATTGCAVWGSAGLVAVHSRTKRTREACLALCSVLGAEEPVLQLLYTLPIGSIISHLSFSSTGLLLAFADHGDLDVRFPLQQRGPAMVFKDHRADVYVCMALSRQVVKVADHGRQRGHWSSKLPMTERGLVHHLGLVVSWTLSGTGLFIAGPARVSSSQSQPGSVLSHVVKEWPVVQLLFTPPKGRQSLWQRLPPLIALYNVEQPLWPWLDALLLGLNYAVSGAVIGWLSYFLPWLSPVSWYIRKLSVLWVMAVRAGFPLLWVLVKRLVALDS